MLGDQRNNLGGSQLSWYKLLWMSKGVLVEINTSRTEQSSFLFNSMVIVDMN